MNPGRQLGNSYGFNSLNWAKNRAEFIEYVESKRLSFRYARCMLSNLDKYISELQVPMDVVRIFSKLSQGQQHNLIRALRCFLNFMEVKGIDSSYLNSFRKAIPPDTTCFDLYVPDESEILSSIRRLSDMPLKYQALYSLLLDSGLRVVEAVKLMNEFNSATKINSFHRCTLGYFRGSKLAYAAYFTPFTLELIQKNKEKVDERTGSHYFTKFGYVAAKYLRKFAFDTMISEGFNIPESVADFIEGRVPQKIGARHYTSLTKQADGYYGRYAEYLNKLRFSIS